MTNERERERQRQKSAAYRRAERDIDPRPVGNPKRRKACQEDDPRFLRTYFRDVFYNPFTSEQEQFIDDVVRALRFGTAKAKAMPRGDGKSTIVKYLQLKFALYRQRRFPLILAATHPKARQTLRDIKAKLRVPAHRELHEDFPFECSVAKYIAPAAARANNVTFGGLPVRVEWGPDHIILPSLPEGRGQLARVKYGLPNDCTALGPILKCLPFTSDSLQGLNLYDVRPDFVMLDDLDSRDSLSSEHGVIAEKIAECLDKTVAGLAGPNRQLGKVFICTITSRRSAAFKYTDAAQKPSWDGERIPRIKTWPKAMQLWDDYIGLRQQHKKTDKFGRIARDYLIDHFDAMHEDAKLSNEHDYNTHALEDGEPEHLSALQKCFDFIADNGMEAFQTEHQNDPPELEAQLVVNVSTDRMLDCVGDFDRMAIDSSTNMIVRGVDIRKTEIHYSAMSADERKPHRIFDYDVQSHGSGETTVEQAEHLILEGLHRLADQWDEEQPIDENGIGHSTDLTLIDKGWLGSWTEDGELKTWASQPVETFCVERSRGLRRWLPAKGAANYSPPAPARNVLIGHHWHINAKEGKNRRCSELIWDANYWHLLVEELFMLPPNDPARFELFIPTDGVQKNHRRFGEHIVAGADRMKEEMRRGSRSRKPRFVRDHWWDSCAMMLLAQSVEKWFRERQRKKKPTRSLEEMKRAAS